MTTVRPKTIYPETWTALTTGADEIDKKLGGGIPLASLTLIEGQSDAGKSVLCQHLAHGSLETGLRVVYYTTENTVRSLLKQMASLGMDVTDFFLMDRLRIHALSVASDETDAAAVAQAILQHMARLPKEFDVVIVDSITSLVTHTDQTKVIDLFAASKGLADQGKTIVLVAHTHAFDEGLLIRLRSLCDAHLRLRLETVGERLVKVLEVAKVRNAERNTGNIVNFDVEPGLGMHIIPISKAKA
jgi:flagellar protein FlaH